MSNWSLKLFIDTKARKVLYAEADKDFVDFLFYIMSLPLASVVSRHGCLDSMVGSLGKLYNSITYFPSNYYLHSNQHKRSFLNPELPNPPNKDTRQLWCGETFASNKFYTCHNSKSSSHKTTYVSDRRSSVCPECWAAMSTELPYVNGLGNVVLTSSGSEVVGFVKGGEKYMVTDDLEVKLLSSISREIVLEKFNVKDVGSIEEKVVELSSYMGLMRFLKAVFSTQSVLTAVFLEWF
nr:DUF674 domain-containing protein [Ipomoea batatas]